MKKQSVKKPKTAIEKKIKTATLGSKKKMSKDDPDYYAKIGAISAAKRKLNKEFFSNMAKLSHAAGSRPTGYHGGRKPKGTD